MVSLRSLLILPLRRNKSDLKHLLNELSAEDDVEYVADLVVVFYKLTLVFYLQGAFYQET